MERWKHDGSLEIGASFFVKKVLYYMKKSSIILNAKTIYFYAILPAHFVKNVGFIFNLSGRIVKLFSQTGSLFLVVGFGLRLFIIGGAL